MDEERVYGGGGDGMEGMEGIEWKEEMTKVSNLNQVLCHSTMSLDPLLFLRQSDHGGGQDKKG
jgi:hypothetical protein